MDFTISTSLSKRNISIFPEPITHSRYLTFPPRNCCPFDEPFRSPRNVIMLREWADLFISTQNFCRVRAPMVALHLHLYLPEFRPIMVALPLWSCAKNSNVTLPNVHSIKTTQLDDVIHNVSPGDITEPTKSFELFVIIVFLFRLIYLRRLLLRTMNEHFDILVRCQWLRQRVSLVYIRRNIAQR